MKDIGLIFDMDGVIVDNHLFHYRAWEEICKKYGKIISEADYRDNMNGRTLNEVVMYVFDGEQLSHERVLEIGHEKEEVYRNLYRPHLQPTAGILDFMEKSRQAEIPLCVGTSAPVENVEFTLDGLEIRNQFKDVLDSRAVTKGKPNPEIYIKCAAAIERPNEKCIVFEDAISGIKAGKAAGSKVIALATSHERSELEADLIIDDFTTIDLEQIQEILSK